MNIPAIQEFSLEGHEYITLNNLLKVEGLCESGAMAKQVVAQGQVLVDGKVELRKRCKIIAGQTVTFAGQSLRVVE